MVTIYVRIIIIYTEFLDGMNYDLCGLGFTFYY